MRLYQRGRCPVQCKDRWMLAAVRPVSGRLSARLYGEYVQDMLRLLLPYDTMIVPGDRLTVGGAPYVCVSVRRLMGHVQCEIRRCGRCGD